MAVLPGASAADTVGVNIVTVADPAGIETTKAGLASLDAQAAASTSSGGLAAFSKNLGSLGTQMSAVGRSMTTSLTLPIAAVAGEAVKTAMSFQQNMLLIRTQAGDTTDSISKLSDQVLKLSQNTEFTPIELSQGLYHIISLGLRGADAMNALGAAQKLAAVGAGNLEDTTNAIGVAWRSGIQGAQDFTQAAGSLNAIVGAGNMRLSELTQAMGPTGLLAAAKTAGVSLNDVGSAEALLADMTGDAQASATHLRMALLLMTSPSNAAANALSTIGINSKQLGVDLQEGGIPKALTDLKTHLDDTFGPTAATTINNYLDILKTKGPDAADAFANSSEGAAQVISKAFGGAKTSGTVMQLLSGMDPLMQKEQQIGQQSKDLVKSYAEEQQTAQYKMHAAWATVSSDMVKLGTTIMPQVTQVMHQFAGAVTNVTDWYGHLSSGQKQFVIDALGIVAVLGPVLMIFGSMAKSISNIIDLTSTFAGGLRSLKGVAAEALASVRGEYGLTASVIATPMVLTIAVAGALAALDEVYQKGKETLATMQNLDDSVAKNEQSNQSALKELYNLKNNGTAAQQYRAGIVLHDMGYMASGSNYAPGGWTMVGENGPELLNLPSGSQIKTNSQTNGMSTPSGGGNQVSVSIQSVYLGTQAAATEFFRQLNQDTMNLGKGLTPIQGRMT